MKHLFKFFAICLLWSSAASAQVGPSFTGTVTMSNGVSNSSPGRLDITNPGPAQGFYLGDGTWFSTSIPYFRPDTVNQGMAFDLMPNGNAANTWEDICSTDIVSDSTDYECLHLQKNSAGIGLIETTASGTGTARDLQLQPTATTAQRVLIGGDSSPVGKFEIVQGGTPSEANTGLSILSAQNDTALMMGAYAANYSYIQSEIRGSSNSGRPLVLMPLGGVVGIGAVTSPNSMLQVHGEIQPGTASGACASGNNGAIRYASGILYVCLGTAWDSIVPLVSTEYSTNSSTSASTTLSAADLNVAASFEHVLDMTGAITVASNAQLPTVAALVAAWGAITPVAINQTYKIRVRNYGGSGSGVWTIINASNSSWTITGTATIAVGAWREYQVTFTSLTAAVLQDLGAGVI